MTVLELYRFLENKMPRALSASWDNDGAACIPVPTREARRVLVALDATERVVNRALDEGFDLLLTHHPLLFRGVKSLTPFAAVPRKLLALAQGGVAALSYHTRLDAAAGGVNDVLADLLGLVDVKPLASADEPACARIGSLPAEMSAAEFVAEVKRRLGLSAVLVSGEGTVKTIALCGGEGGDFLDAARAAGADLYLSGRIGYHRMLDAPEEGIIAVEIGHFASEVPVLEALAAWVREADDKIEIVIDTTPTIQLI
ncbi:MAG: Nif3-like dinuclear metal center hexameric protein [Clostridia bacterium]|nr:Nif3-like dinuclear metal center hexameric protein [Clostridia bacterium]